MSDFARVAIPALLALIGTLLTVIIGYRQWRQQHLSVSQTKYREERKVAYQKLWDQIAQLNRFVRKSDEADVTETGKLYSSMLEHMQKNAVTIDEDDRDLVLYHISTLVHLHRLILEIGDEQMKDDWHSFDHVITIESPVSFAKVLPNVVISLFEKPAEIIARAMVTENKRRPGAFDSRRLLADRPLLIFPLIWILIAARILKPFYPFLLAHNGVERLVDLFLQKRLFAMWTEYQRTRAQLIARFRSVLREM